MGNISETLYLHGSDGRYGKVVARHRNTEGELTTIEGPMAGRFDGQFLLCFYDEDSTVVAPTLLDPETVTWLLGELTRIERGIA
jgi:hypothetical protein